MCGTATVGRFAARRVRLLVAAPVAAAVGAVVLAVNGPHVTGVRCPFHALTGLDCPGCGSTRALAALVNGDIPRTVDHHALILVALLLLAAAWVAALRTAVTGTPQRHPLVANRAAVLSLIVIAVFTVVRNLPGPIGSYLAA